MFKEKNLNYFWYVENLDSFRSWFYFFINVSENVYNIVLNFIVVFIIIYRVYSVFYRG